MSIYRTRQQRTPAFHHIYKRKIKTKVPKKKKREWADNHQDFGKQHMGGVEAKDLGTGKWCLLYTEHCRDKTTLGFSSSLFLIPS